MSYAIIGFGKIGQALAKAFARKRHRSIRCNRSRPGKLCIRCGRDRTHDHSQKTGGSGQGGHRLFGCQLRLAVRSNTRNRLRLCKRPCCPKRIGRATI